LKAVISDVVKKSSLLLVLTLLAAAAPAWAAIDAANPAKAAEVPPGQPIPADQLDFFEKKIRPVLTDKCYKCHSEKSEKVKGGLLLDTRAAARRGGDNGPAVVPGNLKDSLLIEAIHYGNKDFAMPPAKSGGKLPDDVIKDFEKWVQMGAPDPRDGGAAPAVVKRNDTEKAKDWWAFKAPQKTAPPAVQNTAWPRTDIDRFLLAGLEAKGLTPVADADRLTLIRRVYFDLIGIPPTLDEITAFVQDKSPNAFATVVDRLLGSPKFGERWGRHWLDVARYAESSGKDANFAYPNAWRYRDYVIDAFNEDKPYDEFIREQIAGDMLPAQNEHVRAEHEVATGYLAIGAKSHNEQNPRQFALDVADEQIDAISQGILGMTIACARCHDHKFDPIPQREYYALAGILLSTDTRYGTAGGQQNRHPSQLIDLPASSGLPTLQKYLSPQERAQKEKELAELQKERDQIIGERMEARREGKPENGDVKKGVRALIVLTRTGLLEAELNSFDASGRPKIQIMGAKDRPDQNSGGYAGGGMFGRGMFAGGQGGQGGQGQGLFQGKLGARLYGGMPAFPNITDSPLYARGDVDKPGEKVPRGFISVLSTSQPPTIPEGTSGRLQLAEWLTDPTNPMTSRVMVNRIWHWIFGKGIVESTDNFGSTGHLPSNQALLDNLALDFQKKGYSVKKMIREIVLSHAYQLSSTFNDKDFAADPENTLIWRMSKRRLDAECIRDAMLAVSGDLQYSAPIGSTIAMAGDGMINGPRGRGISEAEINAESPVRSVYLAEARDLTPESLSLFDLAEPSLVTGVRETTNVPSQALFMLNSDFVAKRAERLGQRVVAGYPSGPNGGLAANLQERITYAYWLAFSRPPDSVERAAATNFFTRFPANWSKGQDGANGVRDARAADAAWTSFCRALFASAEFRYLN
jgi:cytochrome c553